jgi:hypothetical protein
LELRFCEKIQGSVWVNIEIKREEMIQHGTQVFQLVGADKICKVCIKSGNSCCIGCDFLKEGVGCQKRNTSCTAWLCGLQKYFFDKIGLLDEWENMWEQIPGKEFREDSTPETVKIKSFIDLEQLDSKAGKLFAEALEVLEEQGDDIGKLERQLSIDFELRKPEIIQFLFRET